MLIFSPRQRVVGRLHMRAQVFWESGNIHTYKPTSKLGRVFWHVPGGSLENPRLQSYTNGGLRGSLVSVGRYHCGVAWCSGGGASGYGLPSRTNDEKKWVSFGERSDSSCGSGGYIVYRRGVCASPVFLCMMRILWARLSAADLRLGHGLAKSAGGEGENSVDLLADSSLTVPCVSRLTR